MNSKALSQFLMLILLYMFGATFNLFTCVGLPWWFLLHGKMVVFRLINVFQNGVSKLSKWFSETFFHLSLPPKSSKFRVLSEYDFVPISPACCTKTSFFFSPLLSQITMEVRQTSVSSIDKNLLPHKRNKNTSIYWDSHKSDCYWNTSGISRYLYMCHAVLTRSRTCKYPQVELIE